jgi:hypothetical protein
MLENRRAMVRDEENAVRSSHEKPRIWHSYHFWDFGRASFGSLRLTIDSKESGESLRIRVGEKVRKERTIDREPGGNITYREFDVELKQGLHEYRVMPTRHKGPIPLPDHLGEVCPFQYVEVEGLPADYDRALLKRDTVVYPMALSDAGVFKSSDSNLVRVWDLCQYTMKATNFLGVYIDGERERIPYEADALINQYAYYCVDREYAISRYSWQYLTRFPTWPTEWVLQTPLMAWADYMQTGQSHVLAQSYTDLQAKCLQELAREDGLISTLAVNSDLQKEFGKPEEAVIQKSVKAMHAAYRRGKGAFVKDIVDWPKGEREGYEFRPVNTVVNAFYHRAIVTMSNMASALGKTDEAIGYKTEADRVYQAFNDRLFDPSQGLYLDGEGATHVSPHANMFALALGLVPEDRQANVVAFIKDKGMFPSVYGAQWLLEALYDAGEAEHGLTLMSSQKGDRTWMNMIENVGATIAMEAWDMKYKPNSDWNHAWGAAPADIIPRKLLGIEPIEPGFRKARIKPQTGSLKWAEGKVPTIRGFVEVGVAREVEGGMSYAVALPANMTAELWLSAKGVEQITEGGKALSEIADIQLLRQQDGYVILEISAGRYRFKVKS